MSKRRKMRSRVRKHLARASMSGRLSVGGGHPNSRMSSHAMEDPPGVCI